MKKFLKTLALVFVGFLVFLAVVLYSSYKALTEPVYAQLATIKEGNIEKAYNDYVSDSFKKNTSFEEFKTFVTKYSAIAKNKKASFTTWKVEGKKGYLQGTLTGEDGSTLLIEYELIKENGQWKILTIKPADGGLSESKTDNKQGLTASLDDYKSFNRTEFGYSIKYPKDWIWQQEKEATINFSGPKDTEAYFVTVTVQSLATTQMGGMYNSVDDVVNDLLSQVKSAKDSSVSEIETFEFSAEDNTKVKAKRFVAEYTLEGQPFKQLIVVVPRADQKIIYTFFYTAPRSLYDKYYGYAKNMFATWRFFTPDDKQSIRDNGSSKEQASVILEVIDKPSIITDFYKPYSITLRITNKTKSTIRALDFSTFSTYKDGKDTYFLGVCCTTNNNQSCWTTLDLAAKCDVTGGYDIVRFNTFSDIKPNTTATVTLNFCGSAFEEIALFDSNGKSTLGADLNCKIDLYYRAAKSNKDILMGSSQPFTVYF